MLGFSFSHLLILLFIALLFGSKRLPQLGANLGAGMKAFRDAMEGRETKPSQQLPQPKESEAKSI